MPWLNQHSFGLNAVLVIFFPTSPPALSVGRFVGREWRSALHRFSVAHLPALRTPGASHRGPAFFIARFRSSVLHISPSFNWPLCVPGSLPRFPSHVVVVPIAS